MKRFYFGRQVLLTTILVLFSVFVAYAQPTGATLNNPIEVGVLNPGATYTDTKNNSPQYGYQNNYGQQSDDISYRISIAKAAEVNIGLCSSNFYIIIFCIKKHLVKLHNRTLSMTSLLLTSPPLSSAYQ